MDNIEKAGKIADVAVNLGTLKDIKKNINDRATFGLVVRDASGKGEQAFVLPIKFTPKFIPLIDELINDLDKELDALLNLPK